MKISRFIIPYLFLFFSMPYIYGGCVVVFSSGSVDKNDENNGTDTSIDYIGIRSQATISSINAAQLTGGALAGGLTHEEPERAALNHSPIATRKAAFIPLRFPLVLGHSLLKIEISRALITFSQTDYITDSGNLDGSCGGNFSYQLEINKESEKFSGRISFIDYCDYGLKISGETHVGGNFDVDSGAFESADFSFDELIDNSHILEGEISIDLSDSPILATFSAYSTTDSSGQVFRIKNYSMNIAEFVGNVEVEVFGTFYHPEYGYVELTTTDPFVVHDDDKWPTSGQILIHGDKDTNAQLTTIDHLRFEIEVDINGDGIFDWDSGILGWYDL